MKYLLPLWILINSHVLQVVLGVLEWTVIGKVTGYGQNVTLFCHVSNCCPQDSGWDRYSPEQRTLFIDIKTGRPNKKYDGKVSRDGYTLIIQNLTKSDLNVSYSCVYGVTIGETKFLLEEDVFKKKSSTQPDVPGSKIAAIIAGVLALVAVAVSIFIYVWRRRKKKNRKSRKEKKVSKKELKMLIPKLSAPVGPIEISNITENSVDIEWKSPEHNGGASIKDYSIEYSTDDAATWTKVGKVDGTTHNFSLKGLQEGEYYFKVTATNSKGLTSELKSEDLVKLIAKLPAPIGPMEINNITESSVDIKWKAPEHYGGASITGYIIEYRPDDTSTWTQTEKVDVTTLYFRVKDLKEGKKYHFKVSAINGEVHGPPLTSVDPVKLNEKANINITEKKAFEEAIKTGLEDRRYVRIQVIGKHGVGKSSLVRRLLNETIHDIASTDGIDIIKKCEIRISDGKWFVGKGGTERKELIKRILRTFETKQLLKEPPGPLEGLSPDTDEMMIPKSNDTTSGLSLSSRNYLIQTEGGQKIQRILPANEPEQKNDNSGQNVLFDERLLETETKQNQQDTIEKSKEQKIIADNRERNEMTKDNQNKALSPTMNDGRNDMISNKSVTGSTEDFTGEKEKAEIYKKSHKSLEITEEMKKQMIENFDQILSEVKKNENTSSEDLVQCGLWDFAGQKDYYVTHQTFLTPNAIYLIVTDLEEDIKTRTQDKDFNYIGIGEHIEFWFDSIHCFCKDTSKEKLNPPVILVCTGTDKYTKEKREKREIEYKRQFNSIVGNHIKSNHRRNIYFISNREFSEDDFNGLKGEISHIAEEMDYFAEQLPTKWIQLENALSVLKDFDINIRSLKEVADLARQNFIEKKDELLQFLKYQHKIGNIIFFEDICDYIILQPNWLVKCFRCLVCDNHPLKVNDKLVCPTELNKLNSTGKLSEKLIIQLFKKEPDLKFDQYKDHLLKVLEKFDIIIKPTFKSTDDCLPSYYMPCMISKECDLVSIKKTFRVEEPRCSITPWLVLEFNFLPLAYFNHILFDYITYYPICEVTTGEPAIYCGKAVFWFNKEKSNKLIVCFSQNAISLQIWKWNGVIDNAYTNVIDKLLGKIEQLKKGLDQNISYEIKAKCSLGNFADARGRISQENLNESKKYFCQEHNDMHNTIDMTTTWFKDQINQKKDCSKRGGQNSGKLDEDSTKHKGGNDGIQKTTAQHSEIPDEKKTLEFENYNQGHEVWPDLSKRLHVVHKRDWPRCSEELFTKICKSRKVYHMTGIKKGKILCVTNSAAKSIDGFLTNKYDAFMHYDVTSILQLFRHMKYSCEVDNLSTDDSGEDMKVFLETCLNNKDYIVFDSLVIVFFSCGDKYEPGNIYDKDGKEINKEEIFTMIKNSSVFKSKPKIVIIRTYDFEEKTNPPDNHLDAVKSSVRFSKQEPNIDDLFVVSSRPKTEKGPLIIGDRMVGSYFIQALIHVFKKMAHEKSFMEMMEEVNTCLMNAMVPKQGKTPVAEVMILEHSVQKSLFFFPGLFDVPAVMMKVPDWPNLAAGGKFVKKTDIIPCTKDFLTTIQKSRKIYSMTSVKKGKFFMISNDHCNCLVEENQTKDEKEKFELRYGECIRHRDFDKSSMSQLFKFMGYDTAGGMQSKNTKEEIKDFLKTKLNEIDKDQSVKYDSLVILFLSGKFDCEPGKIYDCNGDVVSRKDILDIMKGSTHFKGKPKICIVQTYNFQEVLESKPYDATDSAAANDIIKGGDLNKDDIFMVSSYPRIEQGPWMIGDKLSGSYFIQALVHVFMKSACEKSFNDLLKEANSCLLQAVVPNKKDSTVEKTSVAQIVLLEHCEEKELYFFPGLTLKASDFTASMLGNLVSQPTD